MIVSKTANASGEIDGGTRVLFTNFNMISQLPLNEQM